MDQPAEADDRGWGSQGDPVPTRYELILEMLDERGEQLPHGWISGDDELGRWGWFRQELQSRDETYLVAVPSNTSVRDLATDPLHPGHGRQPKTPFARVDRWCGGLFAELCVGGD